MGFLADGLVTGRVQERGLGGIFSTVVFVCARGAREVVEAVQR